MASNLSLDIHKHHLPQLIHSIISNYNFIGWGKHSIHIKSRNMNMKTSTSTINKKIPAKPESTMSFEYDDLVSRFKRAKSEDTLDTMYKGVLYKASKLLTGKAMVMAHIAIERALDRCQQDFDNTHLGLSRKINHSLKAQEPAKRYDPEEEMRRLLSDMG